MMSAEETLTAKQILQMFSGPHRISQLCKTNVQTEFQKKVRHFNFFQLGVEVGYVLIDDFKILINR